MVQPTKVPAHRLNAQRAVKILDICVAGAVAEHVESKPKGELADDVHGEIVPPVVEIAGPAAGCVFGRDEVHACAHLACNHGLVLADGRFGEEVCKLAAPLCVQFTVRHSEELGLAAELVGVEFGLDVG